MNPNSFLKKTLACLVFTGLMVNANPVSERTAKIAPIVGGIAVGAGAGLLSHFLILKQFQCLRDKTSERAIISVLIGLIAGGLTWYGLDVWLSSLTPRGKYLTAYKLVKLLEGDGFLNREFTTSDDLIGATNTYFGTSWPLVLAREYLTLKKNNLVKAANLIHEIYQEIESDVSSADIYDKCKVLEQKLLPIERLIESKMIVIVSHKDYLEQMKIYEKHMEDERRMLHEQRMKEEDRWHETHEHDKDRRFSREEKEKDRIFKERILAGNNHPITVTI